MTTSRGSLMFTFLFGGIIGAGVALLYAPYSGVETRRKLKEGAEGAWDLVKDTFTGVKTRVEDSTGKVKEMVVGTKEDLRAAFEAGKDAYYKGKERLIKETM